MSETLEHKQYTVKPHDEVPSMFHVYNTDTNFRVGTIDVVLETIRFTDLHAIHVDEFGEFKTILTTLRGQMEECGVCHGTYHNHELYRHEGVDYCGGCFTAMAEREQDI